MTATPPNPAHDSLPLPEGGGRGVGSSASESSGSSEPTPQPPPSGRGSRPPLHSGAPVVRFLGEREAAGGPFALLGVPAGGLTDELVLAAMDRQIDRVNRHPQCDTPEADEVRLALHAAAAQMLDPGVRRQLIARWARVRTAAPDESATGPVSSLAPPLPEGGAGGGLLIGDGPAGGGFQTPPPRGRGPGEGFSSSSPPNPTPTLPRSPQETLLEHDAVLTLGLLGGWNRRSLRRIVALAHARGLTAEHVAAVLARLAHGRPARGSDPGHHRNDEAFHPGPAAVASGSTRIGAKSRPTRSVGPPIATARSAGPPPAPTPIPAVPGARTGPAPIGLAPEEPPARTATAAAGSRDRYPSLFSNDPFPEEEDPGTRILKNALLVGGAALFVLVAAVTIVAILMRPPTTTTTAAGPLPPSPTAAAPSGPVASGAVPAPTAASSAPTPKTRPVIPPDAAATPFDAVLITRDVAACTEALGVDPAASMDRFERSLARLAANWPRVPRDRLIAAHDAVIEFVYRAGATPDLRRRVVQVIATGSTAIKPGGEMLDPASVAPAAWSVGMLTRLTGEKDLPGSVKGAIDESLGAALGYSRPAGEPSFPAGVDAALAAIARQLTPPPKTRAPAAAASPSASPDLDPAAWVQWMEVAEAQAAGDGPTRTRLILAGLDVLLLHGPEPTDDRRVLTSIGELVSRMTWRADDESRAWLLRSFDDRRLTTADLHAVTSALATRSSAVGVDQTMILSAAAADRVRADLRDRYARVWDIKESVSRDELAAAWAKAARDAINRSYSVSGDAETLGSAAVMARLHEAAWWRWRGRATDADYLVIDAANPVTAILESTPSPAAPAAPQPPVGSGDIAITISSDGAWAEQYLGARRNTTVRTDLISRLLHQGRLGPVDAEVLTQEAFFATPEEVRKRAADAVQQLSDKSVIVNAVLELLPRLPRTVASAQVVSQVAVRSLPGVRDPAWPMEARRALVDRLLELLAAEGPTARVDRLAVVLAAAYRGMAADQPLTKDQREAAKQPAAEASASLVWLRLRAVADRLLPTAGVTLRLDQIERRRSGRLGQARGLVQRFAAEQMSLCELLAYAVVTEQPGRAEQVRLVMSQLAQDRRRAASVLDQINAAERAMLQLWLARFQEDAS